MQHVRVFIEQPFGNTKQYAELSSKKYLLDQDISKFAIAILDENKSISFLTPHGKIEEMGVKNVDLINSMYKLMDKLDLISELKKLKSLGAYKKCKFLILKLTHTTPKDFQSTTCSDHAVYLIEYALD